MSFDTVVIRRIRWVGAVALFLVLISAAFVFRAGREQITLPNPTGPHAVGRVSYDWVDESRAETLGHETVKKREIVAWFWYPATPTPNAAPAPYLPGKWADVVGEMGSNVRWRNWEHVHAHAISDAAIAPASSRYPVLIFSPGYAAIPPDYTVLAEDLASHGFIVVGLAHTYIARVVVFDDGRVVKPFAETKLPPHERSARDALVEVPVGDVIFAMNQLERMNADASSKFFARLDVNSIGILGHSFGGATSAEACHLDARCKAGINLDGEPLGEVTRAGLRQPFMFLTRERAPASLLMLWVLHESRQENEARQAQTYRDIESIYGSSSHAYWVTILGSRHGNFADLAVLTRQAGRAVGMLGPIDGRRGLRITSDYVRAFFDKHLMNAASPLLSGPSSEYQEVRFESR